MIVEAADVRAALAGTLPGQTVQITFQSDGQPERTVPLTLASRPDRKEGFIGLTAADRAEVPFNDDISGGRHIAGTGEITETGEVDPIGGISFKVVGAREAGATDFLVPEHNCAEAKTNAPDGLNLIKVSTLDDALAQLANLKAGRPTASC